MPSKVFEFIKKETRRQKYGLEMIPSENYVSLDVLKALGSIFTNKYSEGYAGSRYYAGNEVVDELEIYAKDLANKAFGSEYSIVQPYSGSPANLATTLALVEPGGTTLGLKLTSGGHLTHGAEVSFTGKLFNSISYMTGENGKINLEEVQSLAKKHRPKMIWVGTTAYPYVLDYKGFASIAEEVGAYLVADIAHIAGLIVGGVHPTPVPYVDVITTTTHKTLRGPRGAMILVTKKGLKKDPDLPSKLEKAVFPGLQGGPHNHQTAAIAVALEEALKPSFKKYAAQIVKNAKVLAEGLATKTETHLINLDLRSYGFGMGYQAQLALERANIATNRNTV
ncbi:serine hydroxymethyltransferase, partial [Candidatus Daviesbacteria bacterium]|nr:serine hydroxymethyltransferase [Candidatus Daviesbacteria bacterium]